MTLANAPRSLGPIVPGRPPSESEANQADREGSRVLSVAAAERSEADRLAPVRIPNGAERPFDPRERAALARPRTDS